MREKKKKVLSELFALAFLFLLFNLFFFPFFFLSIFSLCFWDVFVWFWEFLSCTVKKISKPVTTKWKRGAWARACTRCIRRRWTRRQRQNEQQRQQRPKPKPRKKKQNIFLCIYLNSPSPSLPHRSLCCQYSFCAQRSEDYIATIKKKSRKAHNSQVLGRRRRKNSTLSIISLSV